jgi:hypothetical protein
MTQYKGYYIDHIYFHSKAEIDAHIKQKAVEEYQRRIRYFVDHSTMEAFIFCDEQADRLHNIFGFSYEEIEELEIAAYAA